MRPRIKERPPVPDDSEILAYDNVPVDVAARYLDWPEKTVRLALREGRASFGIAIHDAGMTYKISPGGLVRYKREGVPCVSYETIRNMFQEMISGTVQETIRDELCDFKTEFF